MRLWHYQLLSALPENQFKGQLRELVLIMKQRLTNSTNHLLINKVNDYLLLDLTVYAKKYMIEYFKRYKKVPSTLTEQINEYEKHINTTKEHLNWLAEFENVPKLLWHDKKYLRVCMANLYEKHFYAEGKSRITDKEWDKLSHKYFELTKEDYQI